MESGETERTVVPIVTLAMRERSMLAFVRSAVITFWMPSLGFVVVGDLCLRECRSESVHA